MNTIFQTTIVKTFIWNISLLSQCIMQNFNVVSETVTDILLFLLNTKYITRGEIQLYRIIKYSIRVYLIKLSLVLNVTVNKKNSFTISLFHNKF